MSSLINSIVIFEFWFLVWNNFDSAFILYQDFKPYACELHLNQT
jgi:hypothetical protein